MKAGITGHQHLVSPETVHWVAAMLENAIDKYHVQQGFTSLAIGADQIFAEILMGKNIPYVAIIPSQGYETTFQKSEHLLNYRRLLKSAAKIVTLNFEKPEERAFYEAGRQVVDYSDIILALWDGQPAKGLGGTGDVVEYARSKKKRIVHVNPITKNLSEI